MTLRTASLAFALLVATPLALVPTPAVAQIGQSAGYKFLQSVKDAKNDEVIAALEKPGVTLVNTRDRSTGEGALHIVVRRGDMAYVSYLLSKGADANLRDDKGETAMLLATRLGRKEMVDALAKSGGNVNLADARGETPLIIAVQRRDQSLVRDLARSGRRSRPGRSSPGLFRARICTAGQALAEHRANDRGQPQKGSQGSIGANALRLLHVEHSEGVA